jgi:hypothetical protein
VRGYGLEEQWKTDVRFAIPWTPPSLNVALRQHWSERRKSLQTVAGFIMQAVGRPQEPERGRVRVKIEMFRRNMLDADNAMAGCKPVFDALVRLGWARDDSLRWMEQVVLPVVIDRKRPRTEIEIIVRRPASKPA